MGRFLIVTGIIVALIGVLFQLREKVPFLQYLGKLPGDISYRSGNTEFHFPIVTCIIISLAISLIFRLFRG